VTRRRVRACAHTQALKAEGDELCAFPPETIKTLASGLQGVGMRASRTGAGQRSNAALCPLQRRRVDVRHRRVAPAR
jgi:hypothetical protein